MDLNLHVFQYNGHSCWRKLEMSKDGEREMQKSTLGLKSIIRKPRNYNPISSLRHQE